MDILAEKKTRFLEDSCKLPYKLLPDNALFLQVCYKNLAKKYKNLARILLE